MVKNCPNCGYGNDDSDNFCLKCGYKLTNVCPYCQEGLIQIHKGILGGKTYSCDNCGLKYGKKNSNYKLLDINNIRIKNKYLKKTLTKEEWIRIFRGGDSNEEIAIQKQQELKNQEEKDLVTFYNWLCDGSVTLTPVSNAPIICKKGEIVYLVLENISLMEPRSVRTSVGMYGGPSFKISKNVTWKMGSALGRSESHEELRVIDKGTFVISNKRLVFMGSKKNVNVNLNKIIGIGEYRDGISLQRENKQRTEYFTKTDKHVMNFTVYGRSHSIPFHGPIVKAIIQGQIASL